MRGRKGAAMDIDQAFDRFTEQVVGDREVDLLVFNGHITAATCRELTWKVRKKHEHPNLIFMLRTLGGDADASFRIARCLQRNYEHISLVVCDQCKSAGTLIALGMDEIALSDDGELGPLDVQLRKQDELFEYSSGLNTVHMMQYCYAQAMTAYRQHLLDLRLGGALATKVAAEMSASVVSGVFGPLFAQIDPSRLAEAMRAMNIATAYGVRLTENDRGNLVEGALDRLVRDYPSHEFVIDKEEARTLFDRVRDAEPAEEGLCDILFADVEIDETLIVYVPTGEPVMPVPDDGEAALENDEPQDEAEGIEALVDGQDHGHDE